MILRSLIVAGSVAAAALVVGTTAIPVARASETGVASIHSWRKVGKRTCLVNHDHQGSGSGISKAIAQRNAIDSWTSFTDFEYGSSWANFKLAIEKRISCEPTGSGYNCSLSAVPCRGW
jgi:hypothetical protein